MNRILLSLALMVCCITASAQKIYFIYLQSESEQPFYLRMNNKVHSSTASGYLIIPKLKDTTHSFTVGFPGNKWPEQHFSVAMNRKDRGFILKNFEEKGWGLFDLQTLTVQMTTGASARIGTSSGGTASRDVSIFTDVLAKAAGDPSLLEKIVVAKTEEKKPEPVIQAVAKKEEPKAETTTAVQPAVVKTEPVIEKKDATVKATGEGELTKKEDPKPEKPVPAVQPAVIASETDIAKKEEVPAVKTGTVQKPVENSDAVIVKKEEAAITEPVKKEEPRTVITEQPAVKEEPKTGTISQQPVAEENKPEETYKRSVVKRRSESSTTEGFGLVFVDETSEGVADTIRLVIPNPKPIVAPKAEEPKEEKKFLEIPAADTATAVKNDAMVSIEKTPAVKPVTNNCTAVAEEADFLRIRKRMAAETSDDNMIAEARKYFKTKCFTTQQIKNLNALFLSDESRYKFFDMAYAYVSDIDAFPSLQSELKDAYYINRFKAMLRN